MDHHHGADVPRMAAAELAYRHVVDLASLGAAAAPPVGLISSPEKDETPSLAGAEGFRRQGKNNTLDCADPVTECKPLANLAAHVEVET